METIALLETVLRCQNDAVCALLPSAICVGIVVNPEWVIELSFRLSFLVTLSLIVVFLLLDGLFLGKEMFLQEGLLIILMA